MVVEKLTYSTSRGFCSHTLRTCSVQSLHEKHKNLLSIAVDDVTPLPLRLLDKRYHDKLLAFNPFRYFAAESSTCDSFDGLGALYFRCYPHTFGLTR